MIRNRSTNIFVLLQLQWKW